MAPNNGQNNNFDNSASVPKANNNNGFSNDNVQMISDYKEKLQECVH
jgi:hypothetical protein